MAFIPAVNWFEEIVDSQVLTEPLIGQLALPGRFPFRNADKLPAIQPPGPKLSVETTLPLESLR